MTAPDRYHPVLAALHWLLAGLILAVLAVGFFGLAALHHQFLLKDGWLRRMGFGRRAEGQGR